MNLVCGCREAVVGVSLSTSLNPANCNKTRLTPLLSLALRAFLCAHRFLFLLKQSSRCTVLLKVALFCAILNLTQAFF